MNNKWQNRIQNYNSFANEKGYIVLQYHNNRIYGIWELGQDYRNISKYRGSYPIGLLKRYKILFSDLLEKRENTLHLFCGSAGNDIIEGIRFDINPALGPDVIGNAEELENYFPKNKFKII